jgi:hypothetical protein
MADTPNKLNEKKEAPSSAPAEAPRPSAEAPKGVSSSRQEIAGALIEGQEGTEIIETGEVREMMGEAREAQGDGAPKGKKKDDGAAQTTATTGFTFDEKNLPPVPEMIKKIEKTLRADIQKLERDVRRYEGGIFRSANPEKLSATVIELRNKEVTLRRLMSMASEALKRMFLQMFGNKK